MDKCSERGAVMVKKMLCVVACGAMLAASGEQYTNVVQVLNRPLTANTLDLINESDVSTPDRSQEPGWSMNVLTWISYRRMECGK